jgi:hypothetical protein
VPCPVHLIALCQGGLGEHWSEVGTLRGPSSGLSGPLWTLLDLGLRLDAAGPVLLQSFRVLSPSPSPRAAAEAGRAWEAHTNQDKQEPGQEGSTGWTTAQHHQSPCKPGQQTRDTDVPRWLPFPGLGGPWSPHSLLPLPSGIQMLLMILCVQPRLALWMPRSQISVFLARQGRAA